MLIGLDPEVRNALRMIDNVEERLSSTVTVLKLLADEVHDYERRLFDSGGEGAWAQLSPTTLAEKGSGRILVDTGGLLQALTTNAAFEGEAVRVITTRRGAEYNQRGAHGAPARDPAPEPPDSEVERWARSLLGFLTGERLP